MPWSATAPRSARAPCLGAERRHLYTLTAWGGRVGLRRHPGETWGRRSPTAGRAGLQETPRAPHRCPHRTAAAVEAALLAANRAPPPWGPRQSLPSLVPSPAGARCRRAGRSQGRRRLPSLAPARCGTARHHASRGPPALCAPLPGRRLAKGSSPRHRRAVRHPRLLRPAHALGVVDHARHPPAARGTRAQAPAPHGRRPPTPGTSSARAAGARRSRLPRIHRRAPARGARR